MKAILNKKGTTCLYVPNNNNAPMLFLERLSELQECIPQARARVVKNNKFFRVRLFSPTGEPLSIKCYESFKEYINANL